MQLWQLSGAFPGILSGTVLEQDKASLVHFHLILLFYLILWKLLTETAMCGLKTTSTASGRTFIPVVSLIPGVAVSDSASCWLHTEPGVYLEPNKNCFWSFVEPERCC